MNFYAEFHWFQIGIKHVQQMTAQNAIRNKFKQLNEISFGIFLRAFFCCCARWRRAVADVCARVKCFPLNNANRLSDRRNVTLIPFTRNSTWSKYGFVAFRLS